MPEKILIIGSATMDLSMNLYKVPERGQTVVDDGGVAYTPGGMGANAGIAFVKLGAECALCTKLGADVHGQRLYNFYKDAHLNTSYIMVDHDFPTGFSVLMKEADGSTRTVLYPGANNQINSENVMSAFNFMPDALYLGFDAPFSVVVSAAKIAAARGIPVFVDPTPASADQPLETLPGIEIFSPNEHEICEYTGITPTGTDSALRAAYTLFNKVKCKYIVIKLGSRGSFIYDGKHCDLIPAFKADRVLDTTSAGDTFTAAMTLEYLRNGRNIVGAVTYGSAAAAITVSRSGSSTSMPSADEVMEFIRKKKI